MCLTGRCSICQHEQIDAKNKTAQITIPLKEDGGVDWQQFGEHQIEFRGERGTFRKFLQDVYNHGLEDAARVADRVSKPVGPDDWWQGDKSIAARSIAASIRIRIINKGKK